MPRKPSSTIEDYLMEIYDQTYAARVYDESRAGHGVIAARLTDKMGVAAPTVWNTVHRMERDALVEIDAAKEIRLSPSGLQAAESIKRRHLLTERLLVDILGLDWADAHEEAHLIEHTITPRVEARIMAVLNNPTTCPHGNPFPGVDPATRPTTRPLATSRPGDSWVIDGINEPAEEDHDLMTFYQRNGFVPGARVDVREVAAYNSTITVDIEGRSVTLGMPAAENLRIVVAPPKLMAAN
ncbi:MAG: metal-dependent transcriptional regulator [Chloroflexota bacterium]|nr:metal-dependent transcriptional regulator [Chloroflexota bacterium]